MRESEIKAIRDVFDGSSEVLDDFFKFKLNTRVQLLISQFQLFFSLTTISLAFITIVIGTKVIPVNIWFISSVVCSFLLTLYTVAYIREGIDHEDKDLRNAENQLKEDKKETEDKISESLKKNDFSILESFLRSRARHAQEEKITFSYAPEIATFIFFNGSLFCIVAVIDAFDSYNLINNIEPVSIWLFVPCFSFLLSRNWVLSVVNNVSKLLSHRIHK